MSSAERVVAVGAVDERSQIKIPRAIAVRFWREFWELADEERVGHQMIGLANHYLWRGPRDTDGRLVFVPSDGHPPLLAANAMWAFYRRRPLGAGKMLVADCGRPNCVRAEHQAIALRQSWRAA